MKRIGMLVAVEMGAVLERYGTASEILHRHGFEIHVYENEVYTLYVLRSGVGELAAAAGTLLLISAFEVDMVVNFGVVGGLTEEMNTEKLCIVERVIHYDYDTTAGTGVRIGQYPDQTSAYLPADPALLARACRIVPGLRRVTCASADKFVAAGAPKALLHEQFGADICDMEAAGVLLTCLRAAVPCLLIKAVADGLKGGIEDFFTACRHVSELCLKVCDQIIREL